MISDLNALSLSDSALQEDISKFKDLEYCKTDLVATKGVVFCKFFKSSSALLALEDVSSRGILAGYKVKCMLAEPKTKRRAEGSPKEAQMLTHLPPQHHVRNMQYEAVDVNSSTNVGRVGG